VCICRRPFPTYLLLRRTTFVYLLTYTLWQLLRVTLQANFRSRFNGCEYLQCMMTLQQSLPWTGRGPRVDVAGLCYTGWKWSQLLLVRNVQINVAWAKVLLGHGMQTKVPGATLWKEMFVVVFFLKETREVAVVTLVGRLFHARAAVTWKDRSPMVLIHCCTWLTWASW